MMKKNIVILGAGFGGLKAAFSISKELSRLRLFDLYQVLLIDRHEHHTFTPLLYEVATTSRETADMIHLHNLVAHSIPVLLRGYPITFIQDEVEKLLPQDGLVFLKRQGTISAQYLVLALGSEVNFFNIPGLKEHSLTLKTFFDAIRLRDAILNSTLEKSPEIDIVIGGAGPTGVELAAELSNWCCRSKYKINQRLNVTLVEAQPTILFGFIPKVVQAAESKLRSMGVNIKTNVRISKLNKKEVEFADGTKMPFDLFVWSGGVKTPELLLNLLLKTDEHGRIATHETMACLPQTPDLKLACRVYGVGDNICSYDPQTKKPVPAVAPVALAQATVAAHNLIEDIKKAEQLTPGVRLSYHPLNYPYVVPVGGKYAISKIGSVVLTGFLGWIFKGIVELYYISSIMPFWKALKTWLRGLWVFAQNDQLG